jgi:putative transcriptional regulator
MAVKNRLRSLMNQKGERENRNVTLVEIEKATDINRQTLQWWRDNVVAKRYDAVVIDRLCKFFDCDVGDLLYIDREGETA